jgi:hypothetical protein
MPPRLGFTSEHPEFQDFARENFGLDGDKVRGIKEVQA